MPNFSKILKKITENNKILFFRKSYDPTVTHPPCLVKLNSQTLHKSQQQTVIIGQSSATATIIICGIWWLALHRKDTAQLAVAGDCDGFE